MAGINFLHRSSVALVEQGNSLDPDLFPGSAFIGVSKRRKDDKIEMLSADRPPMRESFSPFLYIP
jgi:hypothetical protein